MPGRGNTLLAFGGIVVAFGLVIGLIFGAVTLFERLRGPNIRSGWAYAEYSIDGKLSGDERGDVAKSLTFRLQLGQAPSARTWVDGDTVTVAVPPEERRELEASPAEGPRLELGGVISTGDVGSGPVKKEADCSKPPQRHGCTRDRNTWFELAAPRLTGTDITSTRVVTDQAGTGSYAVALQVEGAAEQRLADLTKRMAASSGEGRLLAVVYGGIVLAASPIEKPITDGTVMLPGFSKSEGDEMSAAVMTSKYDVTLHKGPVRTA